MRENLIKHWLGPFLPFEHGAWGVFTSALLLGLLTAPVHPGATPGLVLVSLGGFFMRNPLVRVFRAARRGESVAALKMFPLGGWVICGSLLVLGSLPLLMLHRWGLVGLAMLALAVMVFESFSRNANPRSRLAVELIHTLLISLLAPAAGYVAMGRLGWRDMTVWLLGAVYFSTAMMDVRWRIARLHHARGLVPADRVSQARQQLLTSMSLSGGVIALYGVFTPCRWLGFVAGWPLAWRLWNFAGSSGAPSGAVQAVGWAEVRVSILFVLVGATAVRFSGIT